ncbi:putative ribonuclease H-like domain-containing protein [Tanacetum coccineum]
MTHPHPKGNFIPKAVLMKSSIKTLNTDGQNFSKAVVSVVGPRAHTHVRRPFNKSTTNKNSNLKEKVNTIKGNVTTARPKAVVSDNKGNEANAVKASTCWVWRPKQKVLDNEANLQLELQEKGVIDSGCSRHMTGNKSHLSDYEEINSGFVAFGGDPKGGRITSRGKISTGKLDFEDVYFVKEINFNLFSVSQMCDKKNSVLFTDTECVVLSSDFKLLDENHVLHRVPRKDNMYSVDLKIMFPSETPQQNGVAERKNRTLIEAARTMLADSKLPTTFWAEAVNTACYVQNRVLVIKPHNKTPYELFLGRKPALSFMRPFGCPVTILNTLDHLGKFDGKADEGFFIGYSTNRKAYRVFNSITRIVEENMHVKFSKETPNIAGNGPKWIFDINALTISMNYKLVVAGNQTNGNAGTKENIDAGLDGKKTLPDQKYILLPLVTSDPLLFKSSKDSLDAGFKPLGEEEKIDSEHQENEDSEVPNTQSVNQEQDANVNSTNNINTVSSTVNAADIENNVIDENIVYGCIDDLNMPNLEEIVYSDDDEEVGEEADMNNLATTMPVSPIPTTRVHKDHPLDQIIRDIQSAPQTKRMTKNVTKHVEPKKARRGMVYVDDIIFGSTKKSLCTEFEQIMHKRFQMSFMGHLTFFLGLQIAITPIESNKALLKDEEAADVDVHLYKSMIRSLMYLTASRPDIRFAICACARFQVTPRTSHLHVVKRIFRYLKGHPKLGLWYPRDSLFNLETIVVNSTIEAEYVAAANCCRQVLWIQNQLLDYGYNFMNTKIYIDNESTICIVKNPVFHSKTKHIEIRHHFIRDSYEKRLIKVIKIHTDHNVVDLLTKAFDVSRFQYQIARYLEWNGTAAKDEFQVSAVKVTYYWQVYLMLLVAFNIVVKIKNVEPIKQRIVGGSSIKYALTINPTVYESCIQQFWATAKAKTVNGGTSDTSPIGKEKEVRTSGLKRLRKVGSASRVESSNDDSLGAQEVASKHRRKIADLDADEEVTLIDETQERYDEEMLFDVQDDLQGEEVVAKQEVAEKEVSAVVPVTTAGEVVTTANATTNVDVLTLAQTLIEIKEAKPKPRDKRQGGKMVEPEKPLKKKDQIVLNEELALTLHAEEQAELEKERVA